MIAEVNGRPITASQVGRRAGEQRLDKQGALESLIDEELLTEEAARLGLHRDPEAVLAAKQAAIYAMLREEFERDFTKKQVPEKELRALYKLNERTHFNRPELRRFSHVLARRPWLKRGRRWTLDAEADDRLRKSFEALHADLVAAEPKTWQEFEALALKHRDRIATLRSERGTKAKDELQRPFADPLFRLSRPRELSGVLATRSHMHIAFLVEILPATSTTYEEARESILERHFPDAQKAAFERLVGDARRRCKISVRPEHLPVSE